MDPGQKHSLGHLQEAALEPGSAQALGPWVLRIGGGLAEAGEETSKGAWTDCPSCTLGALEEAGPPSPSTAPLTAAHQSLLRTMRLPLGTTPRATQVLSSELSGPCWPRLARLAHSGPSRGQQARGCEECAGPPSKVKYWGSGRGGDTNPAPLPPHRSLPHGKMGAPGEVGEERAPLTTSVDSHFSMSSMRQAWVTGIWRGGQG